MKKNSKQFLFERMHKINPDFILKEEIEYAEAIEDYTFPELHVLNIMAHTIAMNGYVIHSPLTYDVIYEYNQKHGNVIQFPLVVVDKEGLLEQIGNLIGQKAVDEIKQLNNPTAEQVIAVVQKHIDDYKSKLRANFQKNDSRLDDDFFEKVVDNLFGKYKTDNLFHSIKRAYKYPNATASNNLNFFELYPFAQKVTREFNDFLTGEQAIEVAQSLVRKKAIIVIPFTEEEKQKMNEVFGKTYDYLTPDWGYTDKGYAHLVLLENPKWIHDKYDSLLVQNFKFDRQEIDDLITTAYEGGSNYWVLFDLNGIPDDPNLKYTSERITDAVYKGYKIPVYDRESGDVNVPYSFVRFGGTNQPSNLPARNSKEFFDEHGFEYLGELSLEGLNRAVEELKTDVQYGHILRNIATENYDALDADAFLQLAVMGKIVYG